MTAKIAALENPAQRRVTILGSSGSIGCSTVDLLDANPDRYQVEALTANGNVDRLIEQARRLKPKLAVIGDPIHFERLSEGLRGTDIQVGAGPEALIEAAEMPADWVMAGIVGAAGLAPTLAAVRRGATVALANKECLVCAGDLMLQEVQRHQATLLPVDSEHNAIFQVFDFERPERVEKIILTASGGPFRGWNHGEMARVTPSQAVAHPNWSMGAKISVDSATMMNKGLEMIEAYHLFPIEREQISVLVHPQSVVHSLVSYCDGSVLAQLGSPDMRTPIAYTLAWPDRLEAPVQKLDLAATGTLTFEDPDEETFPALRLARNALDVGGAAPIVLNAANEVAVQAFLMEKIGFLDIVKTVEQTLVTMNGYAVNSLSDVHEIDSESRRLATIAVAKN